MRNLLFIITSCILFSCANSKYKLVEKQYEYVVDLNFFSNKEASSQTIYPLYEEYIKDKRFVLKHNDSVFFEGDYTYNDYLYEGFQGKYFFITPIVKPNYLASPFLTKRDSVFLYDLENRKLYNFNASNFIIKAVKTTPPVSTESINKSKKEGFKLYATYDSVSIETNELFLLLEDLKTIETIKIKSIR